MNADYKRAINAARAKQKELMADITDMQHAIMENRDDHRPLSYLIREKAYEAMDLYRFIESQQPWWRKLFKCRY